jgi:RsmE family RNA methyltransferase
LEDSWNANRRRIGSAEGRSSRLDGRKAQRAWRGCFHPLKTERSVVHPKGEGKRQRWERIAIESAKQSRRVGVMKIEELTELSAATLRSAAAWGCFLSTAADAQPLQSKIQNSKSKIALFIGPEGGWTDGKSRS